MFFKEQINPNNLRITLETLINIRWIAVIGQFFTVSFVYYGLKFQFPYFETLVLISLSVLVNILLELTLFETLTDIPPDWIIRAIRRRILFGQIPLPPIPSKNRAILRNEEFQLLTILLRKEVGELESFLHRQTNIDLT